MHRQLGEVRTWCMLSFTDAGVSSLLQHVAWVRCVSASVSCVGELCRCGRDVRRQREGVCRHRSGSAQTTEVSALFKRPVSVRCVSALCVRALCQCARGGD